ncbi:MAG: hypothetical protein ACRDF4_11890, partial [Rhabdochlamydiaceae bacterium]
MKFLIFLFILPCCLFGQESIEVRVQPYLLPSKHCLKPLLDEIFSQGRITETYETFERVGFVTHCRRRLSGVTIARHPKIPGYLFKVYLDSETIQKRSKPGEEWLLQRCIGAAKIRALIKKKKMRYFLVPDKWLYELPQKGYILITTDMELVSNRETKTAWKTNVNRELLQELYSILRHGYGSPTLSANIPYTKSGKFAFIDTEYPE